LIKTAEGVAEFLFRSIRDALKADPLAAVGGLLARHRLLDIRKRADWREFGGAPLLGVRGVVVVAHGRSDARAIRSSVRVAKEAVAQRLTESIAGAAGTPSVPSQLT
jgi:glycerol-3-phosphate acyltransferase PlsX